MKSYAFIVTGVNARFDDGAISLLVACGDDPAQLAARKGTLATLVVTSAVFAKGLCPGATGTLEGELAEHGKRDNGSSWMRIRATKMLVTRKGNLALGEDSVDFAE